MGIRSRAAIHPARHGRPDILASSALTLVSVVGLLVGLPSPGYAGTATGTWYVAVGGVDSGDCSSDAPCASVAYAADKIVYAGTIWVGAGTYRTHVTVSGGRTVTIAGAGMGRTVLDGGGEDRVVTETKSTVTLQDVSVERGFSSSAGGALSDQYGSLRVIRSRVADSWAAGAGGGISSDNGNLSVIDSIVTKNLSWQLGRGGGIATTRSALTLTRSTVSANGARFGGGLYLDDASNTTQLTESTISGNADNGTGTATGAAMFLAAATHVEATHVTVSGNRGGTGGIVNVDRSGSVAFAGSVLAGNSGTNCVKSSTGSIQGNLTVDVDGSCGAIHDGTRVDPMLVPLFDNGEATAYSVPATSVAHNAIPLDDHLCDGVDQHGVPRRNPNTTGCDEGAVQLNAQDAALTPNMTAVDFGRVADGATGTATITLTDNTQQAARITGLTATGDGFHLAGSDCPAAGLLPDGPSCRVTVTFTPVAAPYRGALSIAADLATGGVTLTIPLTGNGVGVPVARSRFTNTDQVILITVKGTPTPGSTLRPTVGWGGLAPIVFSYQWLRCASDTDCTPVPGATGATYTLTAADLDAKMAVSVRASNLAGDGLPMIEYAAGRVTAPPPANQVPPAISGTPIDGGTLIATPGTWTGTAPITYTYQWRRCPDGGTCDPIPAATASSYRPSTADLTTRLAVSVTATNAGGATTADSDVTTPVAAAPPVNQTHPTITGPSIIGTTLTVDHGTWTGTTPLTFDYQWQRCPNDGGGCDPIPGATTTRYTIIDADVEYAPRVEIHAHNPSGTTTVAYTDGVPWVHG